MVEQLNTTYAALAHPIRREVLEALTEGPQRVTELAKPFEVSLAAVSKHIRVLEEARLVNRTTRGREHLLSIDARPLGDARGWLESYRAFWEGRLDALDSHLRNGG